MSTLQKMNRDAAKQTPALLAAALILVAGSRADSCAGTLRARQWGDGPKSPRSVPSHEARYVGLSRPATGKHRTHSGLRLRGGHGWNGALVTRDLYGKAMKLGMWAL